MYSRGVDVVIESLWRHPPDGQPALALPLVDVVGHHVAGEAEVSHLRVIEDEFFLSTNSRSIGAAPQQCNNF